MPAKRAFLLSLFLLIFLLPLTIETCQTNPDQCESQPCEVGAACTCRAGAPEDYRCPN